MTSLAFAAPASCASLRPSSFAGATALSKAAPSPQFTATRAARSRRATVAQYNYNIYQDNEDRSRRGIQQGERVVTIQKPLGLILEEGQDGMVFIAQIDPSGNAALEDEVSEGDIVVAVSATFGEDVWSTRGVGLDRVMKSIRVRAGDLVTLVLETPAQLAGRKDASAAQAAQKRGVARETRGEREVINPVTWGASKAPTSTSEPMYEFGDPAQPDISEQLKKRLKNEIAAPYEQSWILYISAGIAVLAVLLFVSGITG